MSGLSAVQAFRGLPEFENAKLFGGGPRADDSGSPLDRTQEAAFEEGYQRGYTEGISQSRSDSESALALAASEYEQRLVREKEIWTQQFGAKLSEDMSQASVGLVNALLEKIAELLEPFIAKQIQEGAFREIQAAMLKAVDAQSRVEIEGPQHLLSSLCDVLSANGIAVTSSVSDLAQLRIVVDDTTIVSTIGSWLSDIELGAP